MNNKSKLLQQDIDELYQIVFDFLTDLADIFVLDVERGDLSIIELFYKRLHKDSVMQHTINKLLPFSGQIKSRDINFFNQNKYIFAGLPNDRVEYYGGLITGGKRLSAEDLQNCWDYLDTMIALSTSYVNNAQRK